MKLKAKLLLFVAPTVVLPILALGMLAYAQLQTIMQEKASDEITTLINQIELNLHAHLETAIANVELFSESSLVKRYMLASESDRYDLLQLPLLKLFASYQKAYPSYHEIRILLPDGYEDVRSTLASIPNAEEEEGETEYFHAIASDNGDVSVQILENPDTLDFSLYVARKIAMRNTAVDPMLAKRELRGYLVVTISLDFLKEQELNSRIGREGYIVFTDNFGRLLFDDDHEHEQEQEDEQEHVPTQVFQDLRQQPSNTSVYSDGQRDALYYRSKQLNNNLFVVAVLPENELMKAGRELGGVVVLITVAAVLISTYLLFIALNKLMLSRVRRLQAIAQRIGRGYLDVEIDAQADDEIGDLAKAFKEMSANLNRSNEEIEYLAFHDSLTGLPNRRMFGEYLSRALIDAKRAGEELALLFLDLDDFKRINDTLGHDAGDQLLSELGERLTECLRAGDLVARPQRGGPSNTVARLGGDEFIVLLSHVKDRNSVALVAKRILCTLARPFRINNQEFLVTGSLGITTFPVDGTEAAILVKNADIAMYQAKALGKNSFQFFSESMNASIRERVALENALRKAIDGDELVLHYQPLVDACNGRLTGVEALLRWQHPELGFLPPYKFIPLAEETGLIVPIGEWVLETACRQARQWQILGYETIRMSVNVSILQFKGPRFDQVVETALEQAQLEPEYLDIEITESTIMDAGDHVLQMLEMIKKMGVHVSMDDFGTGYSSLASLRHLPIDRLKIDRQFIDQVMDNANDAAIVSAIIAMSKILKLYVTAEGVEDQGQLDFLREHGCDTVQGYLFSRPLPAEEITRFIATPPALIA